MPGCWRLPSRRQRRSTAVRRMSPATQIRVVDFGSELTLRRAASKTTAFELGGGQAEAVAPFRARPRTHATGRCPRSTGAAPRVPSPARPPSPALAAAPVVGGQQEDVRVWPAGRARATPGRRDPLLGGDKTLCHQAGAVGSGRAGCARRGGNRGDCAEPRRVFACPALNGATAAAWPLRGPACDRLQRRTEGVHLPQNRPAPLDTPPRRPSARCRTIPQSQQRADTGHPDACV